MSETTNNQPVAFRPNQEIRKLIGTDTKLTEIFSKERIQECQTIINDARQLFFKNVHEDLAKLERLIENHSSNDNPPQDGFDQISQCAENIKGYAGLFEFTLIASICSFIMEYCEQNHMSVIARCQLISDLTKMLQLAIKEKITDENGVLGKKLLSSLGKFQQLPNSKK